MTVKAYRIDFMAVKTPILMTVKAHRNDFMAVKTPILRLNQNNVLKCS
jgi:hypothetical protein